VTDVRYPYVVVDISDGEADEASVLLFDLGAIGVEQRDETTLVRAAPGRAVLAASFACDDDAIAARSELPAAWSPRVEHVVGDAWRDEWKKYFEPFGLCPGVVVRPPWRAYEPKEGERVVVLEPGRAFGTGLHETTRLVAEAMAERKPRLGGAQVLDVGCGSGILALTALALGAAAARAVDVDPEAIAVTRENAIRNAVSERLLADTTPIERVAGTYDVVLANIEAHTLREMAPSLAARLADGGTLVLSGILSAGGAEAANPYFSGSAGEARGDPSNAAREAWEGVTRAYAALTLEETRARGEWLAAVFRA
jgi:ribosomal protein L11 methyltransferase